MKISQVAPELRSIVCMMPPDLDLVIRSQEEENLRRSRLPVYGPEVQQALFLVWKAAHYVCAKRLLPSLPTLVALLEEHGHFAID